MKVNCSFKSVFVEITSLLFIMLFVYASLSKFFDFKNFQIQLGQSPLLSAHALWVSYAVPVVELLIAGLLIVRRFRIFGLFASLSLMTMFTAYIFLILYYSSFVPCSCGGILQKMSWNAHLIFNVFFIVISILSIVFKTKLRKDVRKKQILIFRITFAIIIFSIAGMIVLFLSSEKIMHENNPFIRRYPQHPAEYSGIIDLKFKSYYIAGAGDKRIYLSNYQYPSYLLSFDEDLKNSRQEKIEFDPKEIPFKMINVSIQYPYFYLSDGSVPVQLRGDAKTWMINKELKGMPYFTRSVPLDSNAVVFRSNNAKKLANVLGIFHSDSTPKIQYKRELLQKQVDGIFDTDGILLYSEDLGKIIYLYYYRNEFIVSDKSGNLVYRGHTIDTISRVRLKVSALHNETQYAVSSPSFLVNAHAAVYKNLLFVHSKVRGRLENEKLWEQSFIIDVYDLTTKAYLLSFPIYHTKSSVLHSIAATQTHIYAVVGTSLVAYKFKETIQKEIKQ